jgi:hypothetical protein
LNTEVGENMITIVARTIKNYNPKVRGSEKKRRIDGCGMFKNDSQNNKCHPDSTKLGTKGSVHMSDSVDLKNNSKQSTGRVHLNTKSESTKLGTKILVHMSDSVDMKSNSKQLRRFSTFIKPNEFS